MEIADIFNRFIPFFSVRSTEQTVLIFYKRTEMTELLWLRDAQLDKLRKWRFDWFTQIRYPIKNILTEQSSVREIGRFLKCALNKLILSKIYKI